MGGEMRKRIRVFLAATAVASLTATAGGASAADPYAPATSSERDIVVPHALPGEPTHRHSAEESHLTAPSGITPRTASDQGVTPPNAVPGPRVSVGEAQPHVDVQGSPSTRPDTGQDRRPPS